MTTLRTLRLLALLGGGVLVAAPACGGSATDPIAIVEQVDHELWK